MSRKTDHADTPPQHGRPPAAKGPSQVVCLCGHEPSLHSIDGVIYAPCLVCACPAWRPWQASDAPVIHRPPSWRKAVRLAGGGTDAA